MESTGELLRHLAACQSNKHYAHCLLHLLLSILAQQLLQFFVCCLACEYVRTVTYSATPFVSFHSEVFAGPLTSPTKNI